MKILITTSGLGSRLGNITQYTNKSLIRLGKLAAITRIIELYPPESEFVVTVGFLGDLVKQYIKVVHPDKKIKFVNIDPFEGDGSSLLYSLYCCKDSLQQSFIFHACDTILHELPELSDANVCLSAFCKDTSHYRTHKIDSNNNILAIEEKGSLDNKLVHIGVLKVLDYELFWTQAEQLLNSYPQDSSLSDCHVINEMIKNGSNVKIQEIKEWFDIGNSKSLKDTKKYFAEKDNFRVLDKNNEDIYFYKNNVIKFFNNSEVVNDRIERIKFLKDYAPDILKRETNFYSYEYIIGPTAAENYNIEDFCNALQDLKLNFWHKIDTTESFYNTTKSFYYDKTIQRANNFYSKNNTSDKTLYINDLEIKPLSHLLELIPPDSICTQDRYFIHGDFVLDNLIIKNKKFKFIDWRQNFGDQIDGGDIYYDLAKMNHSLKFDHNLITTNNFNIRYDKEKIYIDMLCKYSSFKKTEIFNKFINENNFDINKINLLTSLIWINMSGVHESNLSLFLYYLGIYNLQYELNKL